MSRHPWRGHRASPPEPEVDGEEDDLRKVRDAHAARHALHGLGEPAPAGRPGGLGGRLRAARRAAGAARRAAGAAARGAAWDAARAAGALPWPLGALARAAAGLAERGAERLDPTPLGAVRAAYLASALDLLAARPRSASLRDAAATYATDLAAALQTGSSERARAELAVAALAAAEASSTERDEAETRIGIAPGMRAERLLEIASGLRIGSPAREALEREARLALEGSPGRHLALEGSPGSDPTWLRSEAAHWTAYARGE